MKNLHWPSWFYGPNHQAQVFASPIEVPEGWHDSPDKFDEDGQPLPDAHTDIPGLDEALAASEGLSEDGDEGDDGEGEEETPDVPEYDDITVAEIKALLDDYEVEYADSDKKADLYAKLKTAMGAPE